MPAFGQPDRAVAVTGKGIVTALGRGQDENWRKLVAGHSGIHRLERFCTAGLRTTIGGSVDFFDIEPLTAPNLSHAMARAAILEAIAQSGHDQSGAFPGQLFLAAPPAEHEWPVRKALASQPGAGPSYDAILASDLTGCEAAHAEFQYGTIAERLKREFRTEGSPITLSTACASGASTIQLGVEAIRRGAVTSALCTATDGSMSPETVVRFSLLSALSTANDTPPEAAKPFSKNRDGFVMSEGAACLVLEDAALARARGAEILGYIRGCGEAADMFHRTRSNPNGEAIIRAMASAIADAGLSSDDIDYINAHGTGTPENDKMECLGIEHVFGDYARRVPVSSNKSMIGHTLTAAGAVEAVFSLLTLRHQTLPPTINYALPDPMIELDVVPNQARQVRVRHILSNSFGFGGQNVSLVLSTEPC